MSSWHQAVSASRTESKRHDSFGIALAPHGQKSASAHCEKRVAATTRAGDPRRCGCLQPGDRKQAAFRHSPEVDLTHDGQAKRRCASGHHLSAVRIQDAADPCAMLLPFANQRPPPHCCSRPHVAAGCRQALSSGRRSGGQRQASHWRHIPRATSLVGLSGVALEGALSPFKWMVRSS